MRPCPGRLTKTLDRDKPQSYEFLMFKKVAFTMYPVTDPQRARAFYETTLGLTVGCHAGDGMWTEYDLPGGGCLALFATKDIKPSAEAGGSIALEVEDLDAISASLKTQGVRFKGDLIHSPVCRMAIILDSEGNSIILHQLKKK
jgi:predicted enzyme related to lactoylglutathione lyase